MTPEMYYFGPWNEAGHSLFTEHGSSAYKQEESLPWKVWEIDGKLQPHREGCQKRSYCGCGSLPEGKALIHHKDGWTAISFWDRSVDERSACNSTYFAKGTFSFEEMVTMAKERFAFRWNKMQFEVEKYDQD